MAKPDCRASRILTGTALLQFQRFVFQGVDRGFELKSAYAGRGYPEAMIFVEKDGPPFYVDGDRSELARRCNHDSPNNQSMSRRIPPVELSAFFGYN